MKEFITGILNVLTSIDPNILFHYIGLLATISCAFLGWANHRKTEKIKIMESQLSEKKNDAYTTIVDLIFKICKDTLQKKNTNEKEAFENMMDSKKKIMMFGSDKVFLSFNDFLEKTNEESTDPRRTIMTIISLIQEIRKDMFGGKSEITKLDILTMLMNNRKEAQKFFV